MDLQSLSNFIPEGNLLYLILIVSILAVLLYIVHSYTISDGENDDDEIMGKIIEEFKEPGVVGVVYEFNGLTLTKENHQPSEQMESEPMVRLDSTENATDTPIKEAEKQDDEKLPILSKIAEGFESIKSGLTAEEPKVPDETKPLKATDSEGAAPVISEEPVSESQEKVVVPEIATEKTPEQSEEVGSSMDDLYEKDFLGLVREVVFKGSSETSKTKRNKDMAFRALLKK